MRLTLRRTRPAVAALTTLTLLLGTLAAAASDGPASRFWVLGETHRYALREERSATAATDNKSIVITGIVTISASPDEGGGSKIEWSTTDVAVSPDPEPIRRNIPQLGDSILFDPKLSVQMRLGESGKQVEVTNVDEIGAAVRRGFHLSGPAEAQEPFFAKVTSREAIEGAVAKHQLAITRAASLTSMPSSPEVSPIFFPGSTLRIGSETWEILASERGSRLVHGRWSRVIQKDAANSAQKQLVEELGAGAAGIPAMGSDVIERVDAFFDRRTGVLEHAVHTQAAEVGGVPFAMSYELTRK